MARAAVMVIGVGAVVAASAGQARAQVAVAGPSNQITAASAGAARASALVKHPTRLYLDVRAQIGSPGVPSVTPDAGWDRSAGVVRFPLIPWRNAKSAGNSWGPSAESGAANTRAHIVSLTSHPMPAGLVFDTTDTLKAQVGVYDEATADFDGGVLVVKIISEDGTVVRATLLSIGQYGTTALPWPLSVAAQNRTFSNGDDFLQSSYTTVLGDRLHVEVGGQVDDDGGSAGAYGYTTFYAHDDNADLGENDTDLVNGPPKNSWFQTHLRQLLQFRVPVTAATSGQSRASVQVVGVGAVQAATRAPARAAALVKHHTRLYGEFFWSQQNHTGYYPNLVTPDGGWDVTSSISRKFLVPWKTGKNLQAAGASSATPNARSLLFRFTSYPMPAGLVFDTTDTFKAQTVASQWTGANFDGVVVTVKVISEDYSTVRAVLLAIGQYGATALAWPVGSYQNRSLADGDFFQTSYTTQLGDRLHIEVGGQVSDAGGDGAQYGFFDQYSTPSFDDLPEDNTDPDASQNTWFQVSRFLEFRAPIFPHSRAQARASVQVIGIATISARGEARAVASVTGTGAVSAPARGEGRAQATVGGTGAVVSSTRGQARAVAQSAQPALITALAGGQGRAVVTVTGVGAVASSTRGEARAVSRSTGTGAVAATTAGAARARVTVGGAGGVISASSGSQGRAVAQVAGSGAVSAAGRGAGRSVALLTAPGAVSATGRGEARARSRVETTAGFSASAIGAGRAVALLTAPGAVSAASRGEGRAVAGATALTPLSALAGGQGRASVVVAGVGAVLPTARGEARSVALVVTDASRSAASRGEARASATVTGVGAILAAGRGEARSVALLDREAPIVAASRGEARAVAVQVQASLLSAEGRGEGRAQARVTTGHAASTRGQARATASVYVGSTPLTPKSRGQARAVAAVRGVGAVKPASRGQGRAVSQFVPSRTRVARGEARAVAQLQFTGTVLGNELSLPFEEMLMIERIELHRIKEIDPVTGLEVAVDRWEQHYAVESQDQAASTNPAFLLRAREVRLLNYQTQWDGWFDAITIRGVRSPIDDEDFWTDILTPNELLGPLFCTCLKLECARILALEHGQFARAQEFLQNRKEVEVDLFRQGKAHNRQIFDRGEGFPHREEP